MKAIENEKQPRVQRIRQRNLLQQIRVGDFDDSLSTSPDARAERETLETSFDELCDQVEAAYRRLMDVTNPDAFTAKARTTRWPAALIAMRKTGLGSVRPFAATCSIHSLVRAIES